jgi:hypothetical protein
VRALSLLSFRSYLIDKVQIKQLLLIQLLDCQIVIVKLSKTVPPKRNNESFILLSNTKSVIYFKGSWEVKIPLDRSSAKLFIYKFAHIRRLIESGALQPGDQLPSIRSLAENTQVNKLTVIEAYRVLEADGLVHARQGAGYFVSVTPIACPQPTSHFAPPQKVILSEQTGVIL